MSIPDPGYPYRLTASGLFKLNAISAPTTINYYVNVNNNQFAGAIATVHWPHGFDITKGGFEYNMLIIVACACLVVLGGGNAAADRFVRLRRRQ